MPPKRPAVASKPENYGKTRRSGTLRPVGTRLAPPRRGPADAPQTIQATATSSTP
jgi:hypothetical protein